MCECDVLAALVAGGCCEERGCLVLGLQIQRGMSVCVCVGRERVLSLGFTQQQGVSHEGLGVGENPPPTAACETVSVLGGAQRNDNSARSFATVCTDFIRS